jgi:hypothetical protein
VVYNQGFESGRLDDLARWLPKYASAIEAIKGKMWDLLDVVRRNVYHPAFAGSFFAEVRTAGVRAGDDL